MSKTRHSTKEAKKPATHTFKEKRNAKHMKKQAASLPPIIVPH
ncbi:hypothetical protein [Vogesella sp. LIG4]|nr:hypothetical protein [Vogesella sp. LIG4]SCK22015.1 hypothetical protein PSELUDRAFT_2533 [Vogesella sp. LIG4]